ncbi:MAG: GNAT family N-acetyltransferase [Muribaculaceae bacterium]|nr:GNAT family N-acetyltransferase [Muribaculaceae bacterium]
MKETELKQQMKELWKANFHDSDEYIDLVFDAYFDPEYIEYEEKDGRVIASVLAIPYTFGNDNYTINSLYLCGLSTYNKYRGMGIMTGLMQRIEERMYRKGYAFLFLIPASGGLRRYYNDRGYIDGFYRSPLHYTSLHDFGKDYLSSISMDDNALFNLKKRYFDGLKTAIIDNNDTLYKDNFIIELSEFIKDCECRQRGMALFQNTLQIQTFLKETLVSNGKIVVCRNSDGELAAIGLYSIKDNEIIENGRYAINYASLCKLRDAILRNGGNRNLTIFLLGSESEQERNSIWSPMFSTILPGASSVGAIGTIDRVYSPSMNAEVYGMVKILSISEILKFLTNVRKDLKYSILTRLEKEDKIVEFSGKNGQLRERIVDISLSGNLSDVRENKNKKILYIKDEKGDYRMIMRERDLGEILFRKPGGDRLIEEAFGLPALNGKISLLLD